MKRILLVGMALSAAIIANADIKVTFPSDVDLSTITVTTSPISEKNFADGESRHTRNIAVKNGSATTGMEAVAARYGFSFFPDDEVDLEVYAAPDENIEVQVAVDPTTGNYDFTYNGSKLMSDLVAFQKRLAPAYTLLIKARQLPEAEGRKLFDQAAELYDKEVFDFLTNNSNSPAAPMVLPEVEDPETLLAYYESFGPDAKNSIMAPYAESAVKRAQHKIELMKLPPLEGNPAPAFTLKNMEGKDVSLSDFKGKWVILDFWGSWCPWCIKGFPALKEAYKEYDGKVEVIGIDCRDSDEKWRAAVAKYELPWVQVYNPGDNSILEDYRVEGFPTKFIVDPEGKIAAVVVGEDPVFFDTLRDLVK